MWPRTVGPLDRTEGDDVQTPGDHWQETERWWSHSIGIQVAGFCLAATVFAIAAWYLWREIGAIEIDATWAYLRQIEPARLLLAAVLTAAAYATHVVLELLAWRYLGREAELRRLTATALTGAAISNAIGQYWLTGGAVRLRLYGKLGLSAGDVARITAFSFIGIWSGYLLIGAILGLGGPSISASGVISSAPIAVLSWIGIATTLLYLAWATRGRPPIASLRPPGARTAAAQLVVGTVRVLLMAGALHVVLAGFVPISYFDLLLAFVVGMLTAALGQVPGALGVLEAAVLLTIGDRVSTAAVLSALVMFRTIFYLLPLALALASFAFLETARPRASTRASPRRASGAGAVLAFGSSGNEEARPIPPAGRIATAHPATKAYLALLGDKEFIFSDQGDAFIMFARRGRSWIALGDPIGPSGAASDLVARFIERCKANGAWPAFHEVSEKTLPLCRPFGLSAIKIAEEARVDLGTFSLGGSENRRACRCSRPRSIWSLSCQVAGAAWYRNDAHL